MDHSYSETDISMSPSQILERLQILRHMQLVQRGKLQKQQLRYDSSEQSTTATEIVSHFSNNTSYNTFRSLLDTSRDENESPGRSDINLSQRISSQNIMEGVSVLNLSQESEFATNTPVSSKNALTQSMQVDQGNDNSKFHISQKLISLDEMPILSPRKDFETLVIQKLKSEKANEDKKLKQEHVTKCTTETETNKMKQPYLKRGEGMSRYGIQKVNFVIQNTKSLPWRQNSGPKTKLSSKSKVKNPRNMSKNKCGIIQILETEVVKVQPKDKNLKKDVAPKNNLASQPVNSIPPRDEQMQPSKNEKNECNIPKTTPKPHVNIPDNSRHPGLENKGKTWAAVLNKEQSDFLRQLKQSNYYKNFHSPAKSTTSDMSCDEYNIKTKQEMEVAEQNLFDLIEKKVSHDSFDLRNSFFNRFLGNNIDTSGENTPLILKKCFSDNPKLNHLSPANISNLRCNTSCSDVGNCNSECTECSETCSSVSSCCSCKTVTQNDFSPIPVPKEVHKAPDKKGPITKEEKILKQKMNNCQNDSMKNEFNVNMEEMNAKLIATSDLLKDRLRELEDEIEIFRKENANLNKIREELDLERQKFYEEKKNFEQKFTEEKILSEYYLAEEKEKLQKQKLLYERYVRDIRGRLNKKEKDETLNLKKEIQDLKEEIRTKEVKSTSIIARLRNQIKLIEKEKKSIEEQAEKLKKENKRIQHSNEITRRLTNLKYLESINKKLSNMANKNNQVDVNHDPDIKYKSYSIERQSRLKTIESTNKNMSRKRAKSVPNLNVTSRYAKYFSQKDSLSDMGKQNMINIENFTCDNNEFIDLEDTGSLDQLENHNMSDSDEDNGLEKIYNERFKGTLPTNSKKERNSRLASPDSTEKLDGQQNPSDFFIRKTKNSIDKLKPLNDTSPSYRRSLGSSSNSFSSNRMSSGSTCNKSIESQEGKENFNSNIDVGEVKSKYTTQSFHKHNSSPNDTTIPINKELYCDSRLILSPEPVLSRSNSSKTNLNPTEITKPDGSRELRFPNGNVKIISADGRYSKFTYYNGDIKENFYKEGKIKYYYAETKTYHISHADGLEVLEFPDGQIEKRYKDGSTEIRLPNGSIRYYDPKNEHVQEEWRFPDGATLTVSASGEKRIKFASGQVEVHAKDHKRREFPDGTVKLVYNDGTSETRYASGRIRIKDKHGNLIMDSAPD